MIGKLFVLRMKGYSREEIFIAKVSVNVIDGQRMIRCRKFKDFVKRFIWGSPG